MVCAAVGNNVCNSAYTARAVEECGLHEVIGTPFQLIDEVVLAACLFVYAGIEVIRERKAVQGEADGEVEFYVVACVVEAARNVHFSVAVRINEGFERTVQTSHRSLCIIGVTVTAPCERTVGNALAAGICVIHIK